MSANFRDNMFGIVLGFYKKCVANMFSTRRESLAQAYPPTLLGIAFFISSAKLAYLLWLTM